MTCLKQGCVLACRAGAILIKFTTDSPMFRVVASGHLNDGEWRPENAMEPITATIVIVALVALAC
jgi:hypothetical protein